MAKPKKSVVVVEETAPAEFVEPGKEATKLPPTTEGGMKFELSGAREIELRSKLKAAHSYYAHTFGHKLTFNEIYDMLNTLVQRDKERLFLKQVGTVSEADLKWYEHTFLSGKADVFDKAPEQPKSEDKPKFNPEEDSFA